MLAYGLGPRIAERMQNHDHASVRCVQSLAPERRWKAGQSARRKCKYGRPYYIFSAGQRRKADDLHNKPSFSEGLEHFRLLSPSGCGMMLPWKRAVDVPMIYVKILSAIGAIFLTLAACILGTAGLAAITFAVLPEKPGNALKSAIFGSTEDSVDAKILAIGSYEDTPIRNWVVQCIGGGSVDTLPPEVRDVVYPFAPPSPLPVAKNLHARMPSSQERNILELSRAITFQRQDLAARAATSYWSLQLIQWFIIAVGLTTTILVSFSATEFGKGDAPLARTIRILAIIFPALGTAAAAVNSFYSPRDEMTRANHTLASLSQLHGQIVTETWLLACAKDNTTPSKILGDKLADWSKRYQDVLTVGDITKSTTNDRSQGGNPGQPKP